MIQSIGSRNQTVQELSDLLGKSVESGKTKVQYRNHQLTYRDNPDEIEVELRVFYSDDIPTFLRFFSGLDYTLKDNPASIKSIVPTWHGDTVITLLVRPGLLTSLMDALGNISEVEKLEEVEEVGKKTLTGSTIPSTPERFGTSTKPEISLAKRMRVTLKQVEVARPEPIPALV